ncbi:MAG: hypothetical protein ACXV3V_05565, partial [Actinomycetes bacterium]
LTKKRIDPIAAGVESVKIVTPDGWHRGKDLLVCAVVEVNGATGITPLPGDHTTRAKVRMRIEQDDPPPSDTAYADPAPRGGGWDFCD